VTLRAADIDAYFARIGWAGAVANDRATLNAIAAHHPAAIPFENLDPLMAKLVHSRRGGYCFEHNGLLWRLLETIGFLVTPLSGRVVWNQDPETVTPRTHMLLRVDLDDGPVLIDCGFGSAVPTGVLALVPDIEQATPHEPFRLVRRDEEWRTQMRVGDEWRTAYRFDLSPQREIDFVVANWYTSTHPNSHFRHGLTLARSLAGQRITLRGVELAAHQLAGSSERRAFENPEAVCDAIEHRFGIDIPDRPALLRRLDRDLRTHAGGL
jgi:N-hydroxyarylamine O-acetyltransferase